MRDMKSAGSVNALPTIAVGPSFRMKAVYDFLRVIEHSDSTVLITGESGTGKEVIARHIHERSRRRMRPFMAVSCALLSETLIESELFGHERGAFTGAIGDRPGRFEIANGWTVFLDDIDDVPLAMQVKLLRVLQERSIERLGGTRTVPVDVRVIAATKRDLLGMVAERAFREDLYYRLNVVPITLPPLRNRPEDIPVLLDHFLSEFSRQVDAEAPTLPASIRRAFALYRWPGNVRELENACERIVQTLSSQAVRTGGVAAAMSSFGWTDGVFGTLGEPLFPAPRPLASCETLTSLAEGRPLPEGLSLDDRLLELETALIAAALQESGGNRTKAAELLKISRSTLGDRIRQCQRARRFDAQAHGRTDANDDPIGLKDETSPEPGAWVTSGSHADAVL